MFNNVSSKNRAAYQIIRKKYVTAGQATDDNMRCMRFARLLTRARAHARTLRICSASCFSTKTMVTRTRLNVTFIRELPVFLIFALLSFLKSKEVAFVITMFCVCVCVLLNWVTEFHETWYEYYTIARQHNAVLLNSLRLLTRWRTSARVRWKRQ
jgi:hypothetical protein